MLKFWIFVIFLIILYQYYSLPNYLINYLQLRYPSIIFKKIKDNKLVALTIDDAPTNNTPKVLDVLKKYNAKATFFIIGDYVNMYDSNHTIIKRIINEGHEIGNHMMNNKMAILMPQYELTRQILDCEKILNIKPKYFRPGSGFFSKSMIKSVEILGYKMALGNIYPHDCQIRSVYHSVWCIMRKLSMGSVIIMHDLPYNVETLERVLPRIRDEDYNVVSLSMLDNE